MSKELHGVPGGGEAFWKSTLLTDKAIRKRMTEEGFKRLVMQRVFGPTGTPPPPASVRPEPRRTYPVRCKTCGYVTSVALDSPLAHLAQCRNCRDSLNVDYRRPARRIPDVTPRADPLTDQITTFLDGIRDDLDRYTPLAEKILARGDVQESRRVIHNRYGWDPTEGEMPHLIWVNRHLELMEKWPVIGFKSEPEAPTSRRPERSEEPVPALA